MRIFGFKGMKKAIRKFLNTQENISLEDLCYTTDSNVEKIILDKYVVLSCYDKNGEINYNQCFLLSKEDFEKFKKENILYEINR